MTKPEITDETDCPFLVLAVIYPGIVDKDPGILPKIFQDSPNQAHSQRSVQSEGIGQGRNKKNPQERAVGCGAG